MRDAVETVPHDRLAVEEELDHPAFNHLMKVHIIGGPGAGKTTLARRLGDGLGVPAFALDAIAEQCGMGPHFRILCTLAKRHRDVDEIVARPGWVSEGSYLWWTDRLLHEADIIVWLDVPWHIGLRGILARHMREYLGDITSQTTLRRRLEALRYPHMRHLFAFVLYTWRYYTGPAQPADVNDASTLSRASTVCSLDAFAHKVIRCTDPSNISPLLDSFTGIARVKARAALRSTVIATGTTFQEGSR